MRTRAFAFTLSIVVGVIVLACASGNLAQPPANNTAGSPTPAQTSSTQPVLVSMVQLLADPPKFHGQQLQVMGFAHFEFEGNAIYLSKEDYDYSITKNGLWLAVAGSKDAAELRDLNNSYLVVAGTFNAEKRGHLGLWSGSIENITMLRRWAKK